MTCEILAVNKMAVQNRSNVEKNSLNTSFILKLCLHLLNILQLSHLMEIFRIPSYV